MAKKGQSHIEKFLALSKAEKAAEVKKAETAPARPLTAAQRAKWEKIQARLKESRRPGRPVTGKGARVISLTVEQGLLERADSQARKEGISRAALFARGLRAVLP